MIGDTFAFLASSALLIKINSLDNTGFDKSNLHDVGSESSLWSNSLCGEEIYHDIDPEKHTKYGVGGQIFMRMCKSSFLIIMVLIITSCGGSSLIKPGIGSIVIDGLVINNSTEEPVYDFLLEVEKVKEILSVSPILARTSFTTNFPLRKYKGNRVSLIWKHGGRNWKSENIIMNPPADLVAGRPVTVVITISDYGQISTNMIHSENL